MLEKMISLVHATPNLSHHHVSHNHLAEGEDIAIICIEAVDEKGHQLVQASANEVVDLVAQLTAILQSSLLLVDVFNFFEELVLPSVELDSLNVLERLVNVQHSLASFLLNLLIDVFLHGLSHIAQGELTEGEDYN